MDPATITVGILSLLSALVMAFNKYGSDIWKKSLSDLVPEKLRTTIEKELADAAAEAKFAEESEEN